MRYAVVIEKGERNDSACAGGTRRRKRAKGLAKPTPNAAPSLRAQRPYLKCDTCGATARCG